MSGTNSTSAHAPLHAGSWFGHACGRHAQEPLFGHKRHFVVPTKCPVEAEDFAPRRQAVLFLEGETMKLKRAFAVLAGAFLWVFLLSAVGVLIDQNSQSGIGGLLFLLGLLGFVIGILVGFALWASTKGYSPWLGVVLAWIGPFGGKGKRDRRSISAEYAPVPFFPSGRHSRRNSERQAIAILSEGTVLGGRCPAVDRGFRGSAEAESLSASKSARQCRPPRRMAPNGTTAAPLLRR